MTGEFPKPQLNALPLGAHSVSMLTDEALFAACGVRIAFTGREGGVSEGPFASLNVADHVEDDLECVARNRAIVLDALGAPEAPCIAPNQVHGTEIARVREAADAAKVGEQVKAGADAVVVDAPGVAAMLNYADCLSLIIVAPDGRFAVVHAGWRSALAGIAGKAARALAEHDECNVRVGSMLHGEGVPSPCNMEPTLTLHCNAYIGPHIRSECFETSAEIAARFADAYGADVLADSRHVSLARAVAIDLIRTGMSPDRIADAGICTMCDSDRYFSYRASGGTCGRHAAAAINLTS